MSHWQADEVAHANDGYPEQRHAGAVSLGPEFGRGAVSGFRVITHSILTTTGASLELGTIQQSTSDKLQGWKEEVVGNHLGRQQKHDIGCSYQLRPFTELKVSLTPATRKNGSRPDIPNGTVRDVS